MPPATINHFCRQTGENKISAELLSRDNMAQNFVSCQSDEPIFYENKLVAVYAVQE